MQLAIMNDGDISRQNSRLHWLAVPVGKHSMKGNLNDVSEIHLDVIVAQRVEESIKRLLQLRFELSDNTDDLANRLLVQHTTRRVNEQMNVVVEFNVWW